MTEDNADQTMVQDAAAQPAAPPPPRTIYFDGKTNRKRNVTLRFAGGIEILEDDRIVDIWPFGEVRRVDGPPNLLRLGCVTALPLARLEVADQPTKATIVTYCAALDVARPGRTGTFRIVFWSLAAVASIVGLAVFGIPLLAGRLAPLVPYSMEKRIGDAADGQIRTVLGRKSCSGVDGQVAFQSLVDKLREAGGIEIPLDAHVLKSPIVNAMALPGGRVYFMSALLDKATSPDEIAAILAHELGHVKHRDHIRNVIQTGGTSFLFGLLFGDVTGAGAVIFAGRTLLNQSFSRDVERDADNFAVEVMQKLGRSAVPMGELLLRVTGQQAKEMTIFASHPLTEDRLEIMKKTDRPVTGPALLTDAEWKALKAVCRFTDG